MFIIRHPPSALGTTPMGDTCKLGMGGSKYGPDIRPAVTSLYIFSKRTSSLSEAELKFFEKTEMRGPEYCNLKPCFRPSSKYLAETLSGY